MTGGSEMIGVQVADYVAVGTSRAIPRTGKTCATDFRNSRNYRNRFSSIPLPVIPTGAAPLDFARDRLREAQWRDLFCPCVVKQALPFGRLRSGSRSEWPFSRWLHPESETVILRVVAPSSIGLPQRLETADGHYNPSNATAPEQ
jgi:hypothetical protein